MNELLTQNNCQIESEELENDCLILRGTMMVSSEIGLHAKLATATRGNGYLETQYVGF